jgi:hypothetical protein
MGSIFGFPIVGAITFLSIDRPEAAKDHFKRAGIYLGRLNRFIQRAAQQLIRPDHPQRAFHQSCILRCRLNVVVGRARDPRR